MSGEFSRKSNEGTLAAEVQWLSSLRVPGTRFLKPVKKGAFVALVGQIERLLGLDAKGIKLVAKGIVDVIEMLERISIEQEFEFDFRRIGRQLSEYKQSPSRLPKTILKVAAAIPDDLKHPSTTTGPHFKMLKQRLLEARSEKDIKELKPLLTHLMKSSPTGRRSDAAFAPAIRKCVILFQRFQRFQRCDAMRRIKRIEVPAIVRDRVHKDRPHETLAHEVEATPNNLTLALFLSLGIPIHARNVSGALVDSRYEDSLPADESGLVWVPGVSIPPQYRQIPPAQKAKPRAPRTGPLKRNILEEKKRGGPGPKRGQGR